VTNGDGMVASLKCALKIVAEPPPTVTNVVPTTAWQGVANDNIDSDVNVTITGTGFLSTPSVRWVSVADPNVHYDAIFVGYIGPTQMTAVVPSETLKMMVGDYHVFLTNPDQLSAEWMNGNAPGVFTITATPPPHITDVSPARVQNGVCTSTALTISGNSFAAGATLWTIEPAGTACAGSSTDANGDLLCPITVDSVSAAGDSITAHFATCPALGPYPVYVRNPDGQADTWYSIEITPSSDGHLNTGAFTTAANRLETGRWKHATQYGFGSFADAFVYAAGGQDAAGNVLGSVEVSQFDIFGTPGPFHHLEQYGGPTMPRVANDLNTPREGLTLLRTGKSMFAIGGAAARTDVTTPVAATKTVERAEILGYNQMPGIMQPVALGGTGLPTGAWYYRVSAVGPWGEGLATREVIALDAGGQIKVCWVGPPQAGATGYNVYRSLASDGRANSAAAIAYGVTGTCLTDTGADTMTPAPGNLRGVVGAGGTLAAGTYSYRVAAVVPSGGGTFETYAGYASSTQIAAADVTAGNQSVVVSWDALPAAGVTYELFRLDPATGTYKLLTGAGALTATTFTDGGVAFDAANKTPRTEIHPLPPGSLTKWDATGPQLGTAREGLDGVVVTMDPATSNHLVARLLVAGGRDGTSGSYVYHPTAESIGVYDDGHMDAAWAAETPVFAHPRAYYALLTTQDRNVTPFPPPPEPPPCGDCGTVVNRKVGGGPQLGATPLTVLSNEPVYVVAVFGDDAFAASSNQGRSDFESCPVDATTGHLKADCGVTNGTTWIVQSQTDPHATFGADAVLYFSYLYPFYGVASETLGGAQTSIQLQLSAIGRFPLLDLTMIVGGQILNNRQSASTSFVVPRAYYQMNRLLAYVYVIGGWAAAHTENGVTVPAGPTYLVEQHQQ
jgi:hypothetical protein